MSESGRFNKLYSGGEESVFSMKRIEARETLIREIAKVFASEFGLKNRTSGSIEEVVKDLREKLPIDSKLTSDKKVFEKACKRIGEVFNSYFGKDFIDLDSGRLCEDISDKIYSLTVQINGEYFEVLQGANTLIKNIYTVTEALKNNFNAFKENIKNPQAQDFHDVALKTLEDLAQNLKMMVGQKMDSDFLSEVKNSEVIKKYFKKFTSRYNEGLAKIFDTTYNFTSILAKINKLCSKLGITVEQLKKISRSPNPAQELSKNVYERIKNIKDSDFEEYLKTYTELSNILSNKQFSIALHQTGKGEIVGSGPSLLKVKDKSDKKYQALVRMFIDNFNYKLSEIKSFFQSLIREITESKIKASNLNDLAFSISSIETIKTTQKYFYLSGAIDSQVSIAEREKFIFEIENVIFDLKKVYDATKSETIKKLIDKFGELISFIYDSVKNFTGAIYKYGSSAKDILGKIGEAIDTTSSTIKNVVQTIGKKGGSDFTQYLTKIVPESLDNFNEIRNLLIFTIRKSQIINRMKSISSNKIDENEFIQLNAKSIAAIKDKMTFIYNEFKTTTLLGGACTAHYDGANRDFEFHGDKLAIGDEDLKVLLDEQYSAFWDLLEVAEALEIYYKNFFEKILERPEEISSVLMDLTTEVAIANNKSENFTGVTFTKNDRWVNAASVRSLSGEKLLHDRMDEVKKNITIQNDIKTLIAVFSKITDKIDKNLFEKSFKSPIQIYDTIVRFMANYNIINYAVPGLFIYSSIFNEEAGRNTIFDSAISGSQLLALVLDSMLGKIVVSVDTFIILNKSVPASLGYSLSPARLVFGGNEEMVIDSKLFEFYIRIPLLVRFYKDILKSDIFTATVNETVIFSDLRFEGPLKKFYEICFKEEISEKDVSKIIGVCNNLYEAHKSKSDPMLEVMNIIINDVNSKIGMMIFQQNLHEQKDFPINNYDLLKDSEESFYKPAPSDSYVSSMKVIKNKNEKTLLQFQTSVLTEISKIKTAIVAKFTNSFTPTDTLDGAVLKITNFSKNIKKHLEKLEKFNNSEKLTFLTNILNGNDVSLENALKSINEYTFYSAPNEYYKAYLSFLTNMQTNFGALASKFESVIWDDFKTNMPYQDIDILDNEFYNKKFEGTPIVGESLISANLKKELPRFYSVVNNIFSEKSKDVRMENLIQRYPENKKLVKFIYNNYFGAGRIHKFVKKGGASPQGAAVSHLIDWWKNDDSGFRADYVNATSSNVKIWSDALRVYGYAKSINNETVAKKFTGEIKTVLDELHSRIDKVNVTTNDLDLSRGPNLSLSNVLNFNAPLPGADVIINNHFFVRVDRILQIPNHANNSDAVAAILKTDEVKLIPFYSDLYISLYPLYAYANAATGTEFNFSLLVDFPELDKKNKAVFFVANIIEEHKKIKGVNDELSKAYQAAKEIQEKQDNIDGLLYLINNEISDIDTRTRMLNTTKDLVVLRSGLLPVTVGDLTIKTLEDLNDNIRLLEISKVELNNKKNLISNEGMSESERQKDIEEKRDKLADLFITEYGNSFKSAALLNGFGDLFDQITIPVVAYAGTNWCIADFKLQTKNFLKETYSKYSTEVFSTNLSALTLDNYGMATDLKDLLNRTTFFSNEIAKNIFISQRQKILALYQNLINNTAILRSFQDMIEKNYGAYCDFGINHYVQFSNIIDQETAIIRQVKMRRGKIVEFLENQIKCTEAIIENIGIFFVIQGGTGFIGHFQFKKGYEHFMINKNLIISLKHNYEIEIFDLIKSLFTNGLFEFNNDEMKCLKDIANKTDAKKIIFEKANEFQKFAEASKDLSEGIIAGATTTTNEMIRKAELLLYSPLWFVKPLYPGYLPGVFVLAAGTNTKTGCLDVHYDLGAGQGQLIDALCATEGFINLNKIVSEKLRYFHIGNLNLLNYAGRVSFANIVNPVKVLLSNIDTLRKKENKSSSENSELVKKEPFYENLSYYLSWTNEPVDPIVLNRGTLPVMIDSLGPILCKKLFDSDTEKLLISKLNYIAGNCTNTGNVETDGTMGQIKNRITYLANVATAGGVSITNCQLPGLGARFGNGAGGNAATMHVPAGARLVNERPMPLFNSRIVNVVDNINRTSWYFCGIVSYLIKYAAYLKKNEIDNLFQVYNINNYVKQIDYESSYVEVLNFNLAKNMPYFYGYSPYIASYLKHNKLMDLPKNFPQLIFPDAETANGHINYYQDNVFSFIRNILSQHLVQERVPTSYINMMYGNRIYAADQTYANMMGYVNTEGFAAPTMPGGGAGILDIKADMSKAIITQKDVYVMTTDLAMPVLATPLYQLDGAGTASEQKAAQGSIGVNINDYKTKFGSGGFFENKREFILNSPSSWNLGVNNDGRSFLFKIFFDSIMIKLTYERLVNMFRKISTLTIMNNVAANYDVQKARLQGEFNTMYPPEVIKKQEIASSLGIGSVDNIGQLISTLDATLKKGITVKLDAPKVPIFVDEFIKKILASSTRSNVVEEDLFKLFTLLSKEGSGRINNDVYDLFEYLRIHNDNNLSKVIITDNLKIRIDPSGFIKKVQEYLTFIKKSKNISNDIAKIEKFHDEELPKINKIISTNTGKKSGGGGVYGSLLEYFNKFKINQISLEFSSLLQNYLKSCSEKRTESGTTGTAVYRFFYGKIINPLLEESLLEEFASSNTNFFNPTFYSVIKRSVLKYNEVKGAKKYVEDSFDLLSNFYKTKIMHNVDIYIFKISNMLRKVIYYKDIADVGENIPVIILSKIITICNNILSSLKEIKKDINEYPLIGEISKNSYKNYLSINGSEPFYPPLEFLGLLKSQNNFKLLNASRLIFSGEPLTTKNLISLQEILSATDSKIRLDSKDGLKVVNFMSDLFKVFYELSDNGFTVKKEIDMLSVIYPTSTGGTAYSQPLNFNRLNDEKMNEVLEENRKIKSINKYFKLVISVADTTTKGKGYDNVFTESEEENKEGVKNMGNNFLNNTLENIIDKNLMPINLRMLYKTALFANLQILQSILNVGQKIAVGANIQKIVLQKKYKELITALFKNYLITSNKKLKSLELLNDKNILYKDTISDINNKFEGITF